MTAPASRNRTAAPPAPPETTPVATSYEAAVAELEGLVADMESGKLALEASLAAYQRGAALLRYCQAQLAGAEQQVRMLEGETLVDLDTADEPE